MKEKDTRHPPGASVRPPDDAGFIEKERRHRDRTKKRRLTPDEQQVAVEYPPRMTPYKRPHINWVNQTDEE